VSAKYLNLYFKL